MCLCQVIIDFLYRFLTNSAHVNLAIVQHLTFVLFTVQKNGVNVIQ